MSKNHNPCYQCADRHVGCQSKCDKNAKWQAERKAERDTIRKNRNAEAEFLGFRAGAKIKRFTGR